MSTLLITFATPNFYYSKHTLLQSAKSFYINNTKAFTKKQFAKTDFFSRHANITLQPRGAGYWLWKPFYIYQELQKLTENDILIYCDSGLDIAESLQPLLNIAQKNEKGVVLFENYQGSQYFSSIQGMEVTAYNLYNELNKNKYWTKRDAFVLMNLDTEEYWNSPQIDACFQVYRKNEYSLNFVKEWLQYCCNENILTDAANMCGKPDFNNFFGHIHDQAVISLLAKKHELELYRAASQFGNHYKLAEYRKDKEFLILPYCDQSKQNSHYGTLLHHHRKKVMPACFRYKSYLKNELDILRSYLNIL